YMGFNGDKGLRKITSGTSLLIGDANLDDWSDDPLAIENIFYDGNLEKGLTVTGLELGILLNLGFAPDPETSLVTAIGELDTTMFPEFWHFALEIGKGKGIPTQVSGETSNPRFYSERADTNLSPVEKENKETGTVSKQTNFFGNKNVKLEEK
ncbi:MAG: hypothetical protein RLZZ519_3420, partial [Bacteroidota bacterium]